MTVLDIFRKIDIDVPRTPETCLGITNNIPEHVSGPPGRLRRPAGRSRRLSSSSGASGATSDEPPRMVPGRQKTIDFQGFSENHKNSGFSLEK